jgi:putative Holliday junction resolvase
MALDVGGRRIGVAVSDPLGIIAQPLTVVMRHTDEAAIEQLKRLIVEQAVGRLIVGLPRSMSGEINVQGHAVQAFADLLAASIDVPLELWDERLSTVMASRLLAERGQSAREQKKTIDAAAAAVILRDYLDAQRLHIAFEEDYNNEEDGAR